MKRLIATDFDGTFIRGHKIDPADLAAVEAWRKTGRLFGFVTGRGADFFETAQAYGAQADFFLLYNGAMLALPDKTVIKEYLIPQALIAELARFFEGIEDVCDYQQPDGSPYSHQYYARMPDQARALAVAEEINRRYGTDVTAFVNGWHINVGKKGSSKAQGVFDALEYFGLPPEAAAVFGDDYNDMEMIAAHAGWAVATARPEVLAMAPHICGSVGEAARELLKE